MLSLAESQAHYLRNVLRKQPGDGARIFNGRDGEWLATIQEAGKKAVRLECASKILAQPDAGSSIRLIFAPIRKNRMDFLIEKSVELGVTRLSPVLTRHTENRHVNMERLHSQIVEAAEQCERLDIPQLDALQPLQSVFADDGETILACLERADAPALHMTAMDGDIGLLIGPEGGFSSDEAAYLSSQPRCRPVSLGDRILRSETAALAGLALIGARTARSR